MYNQHIYQAVVGSLLYLSTKTAYAIDSVADFCVNPI